MALLWEQSQQLSQFLYTYLVRELGCDAVQ
jgi:hypothetical protein